MARHKDANWTVSDAPTSWDEAMVAVLMDIRDELKAMNTKLRVLQCPGFLAMPRKLDRIGRNTERRKKRG